MAKKQSKKTSRKKASSGSPLAEKLQYLRDQCGLTSVAAADRSGGGGLPEGRGQAVRMEEATIKLNKNQDPMITWHLIGIDEGNNNRHEFVNINLTAEGKSFPYARADVEAMDLSWEDEIDACLDLLVEHPDAEAIHIEAAEGLEILVDVWKKAEFKNVAIVGLAEGQSDAKPAGKKTASKPDTMKTDLSDEGNDITKEDIEAMDDDELEALARSDTDIDPDEVDTYDELREMLIKELC